MTPYIAPQVAAGRAGRWILRRAVGEFGGIWIALVALLGLCALLAPGTLRPGALLALAPFASFLGIAAVGQMLVIRQRGLDMSAGSMMTLSGLVLGLLSSRLEMTFVPALATLLLAASCGAFNGLLVARVNISPIVATLAVDALLIGAVRAVSGGTAKTMPVNFQRLAHGTLVGLPSSMVIALGCIALLAVLMNLTRPGRNFIAVGASPRAAAASGLRVLHYQVGAYAAASACFSLAGMLLAGFAGSASQTAGADFLLPGIVAVIVGGTRFFRGKGQHSCDDRRSPFHGSASAAGALNGGEPCRTVARPGCGDRPGGRRPFPAAALSATAGGKTSEGPRPSFHTVDTTMTETSPAAPALEISVEHVRELARLAGLPLASERAAAVAAILNAWVPNANALSVKMSAEVYRTLVPITVLTHGMPLEGEA